MGTPRAAERREAVVEVLLAELALDDHVAAEGLVDEVGAAVDRHAGFEDDPLPDLAAADLQHRRARGSRGWASSRGEKGTSSSVPSFRLEISSSRSGVAITRSLDV